MFKQQGLKTIAIFEASKGLLALVVSFGIHELAGRNIQQALETLMTHLHLNPASHLPSIMLHATAEFSHVNLVLVAIAGLLYSIIRFVEAYGLWHSYRWTEWFALISGAIYLPFELYELITKTSVFSVSLFLLNLAIVTYLLYLLKKQHPHH